VKRWIFTGFRPFLEYDYNPSWEVARSAARTIDGQAHLLKVDFEAAREAHRVYENDGTPGLIVHLGLAARRDHVAFERFAHNIFGMRDDRPQESETDDALVEGGDLALQTELKLGRLVEAYHAHAPDGLPPAEISRDAGAFVCNATYYHSLRAFSSAPVDVLFVHVPMLKPTEAVDLGETLANALAAELASG